MQWQMVSPRMIHWDISDPPKVLNFDEIHYFFAPSFTMSHKPERSFAGFKSVHQMDITWTLRYILPGNKIFFSCILEHPIVILYRNTNFLYERFVNMLMLSLKSCEQEFDLAKKETILFEFPYPDQFDIDEKQLNEIVSLLQASDEP